jgi:hypothetical protein
MKRLKFLTLLPLCFLMLTTLALPAMAYTIDGDISDWGVNLASVYNGNNNGWIPQGHPNVEWIVENNIDPRYTNDPSYPDHSGYSSTGVHMKGTGSNSNTLDIEPKMYHPDWWSNANGRGGYYLQPSGGEPYDVEAVYFDDDNTSMYIAIVTSVPPGGSGGYKMGDIALDINQNDGKTGDAAYEYGIETLKNGSTTAGTVLENPTWEDPASNQFSQNGPYNCSGGSKVGSGTLVYKNSTIQETVNTGTYYKYIIEARIPKSAIGNPSAGQMANLHLTIGCGNDVVEFKPTFKTNIPEFPTIVLPVAAIMGLMLIFGRRKKE